MVRAPASVLELSSYTSHPSTKTDSPPADRRAISGDDPNGCQPPRTQAGISRLALVIFMKS